MKTISKSINKNIFILIPKEVIETSIYSTLGIAPYLAIAVSYGLNRKVNFKISDFCNFANKSSIQNTKESLIEALTVLQEQGRIAFAVDNGWFMIDVLDEFDRHDSFAKIYTDELYTLHQEQHKSQTCKLLTLLSYIRLNMNSDGLYYKTYNKIAKNFGTSSSTVSKLCRVLKDENIIAIKQIDNGYQNGEYKSNFKFNVFGDKKNPKWQTALKKSKPKFAEDYEDLY